MTRTTAIKRHIENMTFLIFITHLLTGVAVGIVAGGGNGWVAFGILQVVLMFWVLFTVARTGITTLHIGNFTSAIFPILSVAAMCAAAMTYIFLTPDLSSGWYFLIIFWGVVTTVHTDCVAKVNEEEAAIMHDLLESWEHA